MDEPLQSDNSPILITGASGLVGSHLLFSLLEKSQTVKALIRSEKSKEQINKVFAYYTDKPDGLLSKVDWVFGDITDKESLAAAMEGISGVYHCAAFISFARSDYDTMCRVNIDGTANIVNLCIAKSDIKLVYVSSIAAIGKPRQGNDYSEDCGWPSGAQSPYSYTKTKAELEVWRGISEGLDAIIVNPSVIIGPGNWDKGSGQLFSVVANGLKFYTRGTTGFIGVWDVVSTMVTLMDLSVSGERFILSTENLTYNQLFTSIAHALHKTPPKYPAKKWVTSIAWRLEGIIGFVMNRPPKITKWSVRAGQIDQNYFSTKFFKLLKVDFLPIEQVIKRTAEKFPKAKT